MRTNKILIHYCLFVVVASQAEESLLLVHTIFRHGDRNPDTISLYSTSPYYNESYYAPHGYGQLTNAGKLKAYRIGTALRERYNGFLDETYNIDLIEPRSTDFSRAKESLQAMLAGLFPPTKDLMWLEGLNWQPISINYLERQYDKELLFYCCPNWGKMVGKYLQSENGRALIEKYKDTLKYISDNTGENIDLVDTYYLYIGFVIQEELNFILPEWTKRVYPYPMKNITAEYYNFIYSAELLKMTEYLLKKVIIDTRNKIEGKLPKKKMFIYSGHEINIVSMLKVVDLRIKDVPPYGSYILIELHKVNGSYGIKLFYQDYSTDNPLPLKLPSCEEFCPFEKFVSLTNKFIPEDDSICGTASTGVTIAISSHFLAFLLFTKTSYLLLSDI